MLVTSKYLRFSSFFQVCLHHPMAAGRRHRLLGRRQRPSPFAAEQQRVQVLSGLPSPTGTGQPLTAPAGAAHKWMCTPAWEPHLRKPASFLMGSTKSCPLPRETLSVPRLFTVQMSLERRSGTKKGRGQCLCFQDKQNHERLMENYVPAKGT